MKGSRKLRWSIVLLAATALLVPSAASADPSVTANASSGGTVGTCTATAGTEAGYIGPLSTTVFCDVNGFLNTGVAVGSGVPYPGPIAVAVGVAVAGIDSICATGEALYWSAETGFDIFTSSTSCDG